MKNKVLLSFVLALLVILVIAAEPPVLRQFGTTNPPITLTNIIKSLATGGGGGPQLWSNKVVFGNGFVYEASGTNGVLVGSTAIFTPGWQMYVNYNGVNPDPTSKIIFLDAGAEVIRAQNDWHSGSAATNGELAGVFGIVSGGAFVDYAVLGFATPQFADASGSTNVGVAGMATRYGSVNGVYVGGYFGTSEDDSVKPSQRNAALIAEVLNGHTDDIFIGETNGVVLAEIDYNGVMSAIRYVGQSYTASSNSLSTWPTTPVHPGDTFIGNSNGVVYALYSGVAGVWVKTNLISGP